MLTTLGNIPVESLVEMSQSELKIDEFLRPLGPVVGKESQTQVTFNPLGQFVGKPQVATLLLQRGLAGVQLPKT